MPRGVLLGEPEALGWPPWDRRPGDACLVLARDPDTGEAVPAAMRWGFAPTAERRHRILLLRVEQLRRPRLGRRMRCLVPIDGYVQRGVKRTRIGVAVAADMTLAVAALWEDGPGGPSFAIVTTEANEVLAAAHERMPALLPPSLWPMWLDEQPLAPADLVLLERPAPPAWLRARALAKDAPRLRALPVARQLAEWAPGSRLWKPARGAPDALADPEIDHAVG